MIIQETTIPHIFRNKYLRGSGSATIKGGGATSNITVEGGQGNSNYAEHAGKAEIAEIANSLAEVLNIYGNAWSGTTDLNNITATTANIDDLIADNGDITNLNAGELTVSGDTHVKDLYSSNITNTNQIKTKDLTVTGTAHFFELIIDKIKAAGGAIMLTPADGFAINKVEQVEGGYKLYFRSDDGDGKGILNMWKVNDQALCMSFNQAEVGTSYNVNNKYYWSLVTEIDEQPVKVDIDGDEYDCHYIVISNSIFDGTVNPEVGDEIVMCGYRGTDDVKRQSATYISAYSSLDKGLEAPLFATYKGINTFDLESHRKTFIDATRAEFIGSLKVSDGTTVEDYVNGKTTELRNEFKVDVNGLTSKVSRIANPNILPSNDWTDAKGKRVLQENEEDYTLTTADGQQRAIEELAAFPPIMYLDKGDYTMSVYGCVKYKPIAYGYVKDNLEFDLSVLTEVNTNNKWHNNKRSSITFYAPIDGYYHIGFDLMDDSYSGDTKYNDSDEVDDFGNDTTEREATRITYSIPNTQHFECDVIIGSTEIKPDSYKGNITYQSSNINIATVDENGVITTHNPGTVYITATANRWFDGKTTYLPNSSTITLVIEQLIRVNTKINFTTTATTYTIGDTFETQVDVNPVGYDGKIEYTSDNPNIATIDEHGVVTIHNNVGGTNLKAKLCGKIINGYRYMESESIIIVSDGEIIANLDDMIDKLQSSDSYGVNLLKNNGFEDGLNGWEGDGVLVTDKVEEGNHALLLDPEISGVSVPTERTKIYLRAGSYDIGLFCIGEYTLYVETSKGERILGTTGLNKDTSYAYVYQNLHIEKDDEYTIEIKKSSAHVPTTPNVYVDKVWLRHAYDTWNEHSRAGNINNQLSNSEFKFTNNELKDWFVSYNGTSAPNFYTEKGGWFGTDKTTFLKQSVKLLPGIYNARVTCSPNEPKFNLNVKGNNIKLTDHYRSDDGNTTDYWTWFEVLKPTNVTVIITIHGGKVKKPILKGYVYDVSKYMDDPTDSIINDIVAYTNVNTLMEIGWQQTIDLHMSVNDYDGNIIYTSSVPDILSVDNNGKITAKGVGGGYITIEIPSIIKNGVTYNGYTITTENITSISPHATTIQVETKDAFGESQHYVSVNGNQYKRTCIIDDDIERLYFYYTSKVTRCKGIVKGTSLESMFNVSNSTYGEGMQIEEANLSELVVDNVTSFKKAFYYCKKLKTLDLSNWNIQPSSDVTDMFAYDDALTTIIMKNCNQTSIDVIKNALNEAGILDNVTIVTD